MACGEPRNEYGNTVLASDSVSGNARFLEYARLGDSSARPTMGTTTPNTANDMYWVYGEPWKIQIGSTVSVSSVFSTKEVMSLYKVYLINLDSEEITEVNVLAKNQSNAEVKALLAEKITDPDNYFRHVQFIYAVPELND